MIGVNRSPPRASEERMEEPRIRRSAETGVTASPMELTHRAVMGSAAVSAATSAITSLTQRMTNGPSSSTRLSFDGTAAYSR
jgi:hypothetical protein